MGSDICGSFVTSWVSRKLRWNRKTARCIVLRIPSLDAVEPGKPPHETRNTVPTASPDALGAPVRKFEDAPGNHRKRIRGPTQPTAPTAVPDACSCWWKRLHHLSAPDAEWLFEKIPWSCYDNLFVLNYFERRGLFRIWNVAFFRPYFQLGHLHRELSTPLIVPDPAPISREFD